MQSLSIDVLSKIVANLTLQTDYPLVAVSMVAHVNSGLRTAASESSVWKTLYEFRWRGAQRKHVDCKNWKARYHASELEVRISIEAINTQNTGCGRSMLDAVGALGCQTPAAAAHFLWTHRRTIEPCALAQMLASSAMPSLLPIFVSKFKFHGMSITSALRLMLNTLAPSNSSGIISGGIEAIGWEFARQNVNELPWVQFSLESEHRLRQQHSSAADIEKHANVSTVMLASYMLDKDLHMQVVQRKLSPEQFIAYVHGMNSCYAIPELVLVNIYNDIQMKPLRS